MVYSELGQINLATETWQYTYDADGLRTKATNGYTTYEYTYNGGQLTRMEVNGSDVLEFFYDGNGKPLFLRYNDAKYFYATNLQGDVTAIVSAGGTIRAQYTYDAWGNLLSVTGPDAKTLGKLNPLRYRGYTYDQETHLYYLQSRYYDPTLGRFINADAYASTGQGLLGNNMFAYCGNNPVDRKDPTGHAFVQMSFDPDGASGMLTPGPWGGGSGGVGYAAGGASSLFDADFTEEKKAIKEFLSDVGTAISSGAEALWDAYVHSVVLQAQMQHQQDMAIKAMWEDAFSSPVRLYEFVGMTGANVSAFVACAKLAAASEITLGPVVGTAVTVVGAVIGTIIYFDIFNISELGWEELCGW